MLLGPVFTAEMVTAARRRRYFLLRLLFAAGLLLLLWTCCLGVRGGRDIGGELTLSESSELATAFFMSFSWITLGVTLLVVPAIAAGSIATERDRRTIEYLFATDLSNAEIVLAKLVAKLLLVGKLLIVALPVIAIFRLLGGIPGDLLLAFYVILGSTSLLLVMLSLSISVWTTRARDAMTRVYLLLIAVLIIPTVLWAWMRALQASGVGLTTIIDAILFVCEFFNSVNPLWVYGQAIGGGGGALGISLDTSAIWQMAGIHLAISAVLATISVLAVRRVHLNSISASKRETKSRRTRRVGERPMLWKECFAKSAATKLGWIGRAALILIVVVSMGITLTAFVSLIINSNQWQAPWEQFMGATATMSAMYGTGVVLLVGVRAAGLVSYEKERDCWLSLLSTPLSAGEIVGGKVVGNLYAFRWLPLPLAFTWLLQLYLNPATIIAGGFTFLMLLVTCLFASVVGVAFSLKFSTTLKSIGATMGVLIMVGGGYVLCCCVPTMIGSDGEGYQVVFALVIPFLLAIPSMATFDGMNDEGWLVIDYLIGLFVYGIATVVIYELCRQNFDQLAGRTIEKSRTANAS